MSKVELTPAFLDRLRGLAQNCQPPIWEVNEHSDVVSVAHTVAECGYDEDAQFIAEADPATVLTLIEEIERSRKLRGRTTVIRFLMGRFSAKKMHDCICQNRLITSTQSNLGLIRQI